MGIRVLLFAPTWVIGLYDFLVGFGFRVVVEGPAGGLGGSVAGRKPDLPGCRSELFEKCLVTVACSLEGGLECLVMFDHGLAIFGYVGDFLVEIGDGLHHLVCLDVVTVDKVFLAVNGAVLNFGILVAAGKVVDEVGVDGTVLESGVPCVSLDDAAVEDWLDSPTGDTGDVECLLFVIVVHGGLLNECCVGFWRFSSIFGCFWRKVGWI